MASGVGKWAAVEGNFDGRHSTVRTTLKSGYEIDFVIARNIDGVLICTGLTIEYPEKLGLPSQSINSSFFQKLGFGELLTQARGSYVEWGDIVNEIYEEEHVDELLSDWTQLGPAGFPEQKYAAIAWKYEKFVMLGLENPVSALAEYLKCDKTTASGRILEARRRGLLTAPKQGNFGGTLTNAGKKLLGIEVQNAKKK